MRIIRKPVKKNFSNVRKPAINKIAKHNFNRKKFAEVSEEEYDDLVEEHGMEYLQEENSDYAPFEMTDLDDMFEGSSVIDILGKAFSGYRYNPYNADKHESFNPYDEYCAFNGYANLVSIMEDDLVAYMKDQFWKEDFVEWCKDNGYVEKDEEDEEE